MKPGIHLGRRKARWRPVVSAVLWLCVPITIVHFAVRFGEWRDLAAIREDLAGHDGVSRENAAMDWDDSDLEVMARLRGALDLGAPAAVTPTEVFRLLDATVPDRIVLVSVSIEPSPTHPSLMLEAVAERAGDVTKLQESVANSGRVVRTQLLEERRNSDGALSVRLQVDLTEGRRR